MKKYFPVTNIFKHISEDSIAKTARIRDLFLIKDVMILCDRTKINSCE